MAQEPEETKSRKTVKSSKDDAKVEKTVSKAKAKSTSKATKAAESKTEKPKAEEKVTSKAKAKSAPKATKAAESKSEKPKAEEKVASKAKAKSAPKATKAAESKSEKPKAEEKVASKAKAKSAPKVAKVAEPKAEKPKSEEKVAPKSAGSASKGKAELRLLQIYRRDTVPTLQREFGIENIMATPKIERVHINVSLGEAVTNGNALRSASRDMANIIGQKAVPCRAKKSISNFSLREGQVVGLSATLRRRRMWYFLDRLFNIALTRVRDFRGLPLSGFDGRGNYTLGIQEQVIFPEIDYNEIDKLRGFQVTIVTSAANDEEGLRLLELLGAPFVRRS